MLYIKEFDTGSVVLHRQIFHQWCVSGIGFHKHVTGSWWTSAQSSERPDIFGPFVLRYKSAAPFNPSSHQAYDDDVIFYETVYKKSSNTSMIVLPDPASLAPE
jgi:hypothetical protein